MDIELATEWGLVLPHHVASRMGTAGMGSGGRVGAVGKGRVGLHSSGGNLI